MAFSVPPQPITLDHSKLIKESTLNNKISLPERFSGGSPIACVSTDVDVVL